jgi:hypothetical protein
LFRLLILYSFKQDIKFSQTLPIMDQRHKTSRWFIHHTLAIRQDMEQQQGILATTQHLELTIHLLNDLNTRHLQIQI